MIDIAFIKAFTLDYLKTKCIKTLSETKETVASAIAKIYSDALKEYPDISNTIEGDIRKYHFVGSSISEEGIVKYLFDNEYTLNVFYDDLKSSSNIQDFTKEDFKKFLDIIEKLAKKNPQLLPIISLNKIGKLEEKVNTIINPDLILSIDQFINQSEHRSLQIATPLKNKFYGRKRELEDGLQKISDNDVLILKGDPGVGKTKFAIELCTKFIAEHNDYSFYCLTSFSTKDAYFALHHLLKTYENIIILVDDANRVCGNYLAVLNQLPQIDASRLKIVVTVRNYAFDFICKETSSYKYSQLEILPFSRTDIENILKTSDFNIKNELFLSRINDIAKGNARLAIMCAKVAIEKGNIKSLTNVEQLFDAYFGSIYDGTIKLLGDNLLKTLGIISFFRIMRRENEEYNNVIYKVFNIDKDTFWNACVELNKLELVDLFETEIVKMSDQTLTTYLHYRLFFVEKILSYNDIINNFLNEDRRIKDCIIPILNNFKVESDNDVVGDYIISLWDQYVKSKNHDQILLLLQSFWFLIPLKALVYFRQWINSLIQDSNDYDFDYDANCLYSYDKAKELDILSNIGVTFHTYSDASLELMFSLIQKEPHNVRFLLETLKSNWMVKRFSDKCHYHLQHRLIDFLIEKNSKSVDVMYSQSAIMLAPYLLSTQVIDTESNGHEFRVFSGCLSFDKDLQTLRKKYWEYLFKLSSMHPIEFRRFLLSSNLWGDKKTEIFFNHDIEIIIDGFKKYFSNSSFLDYYTIKKFFNKFNWLKMKYDSSLLESYSCQLLDTYLLFTIDGNGKELLLNHPDRVAKECLNYTYDDYINHLSNLKEINDIKLQLDGCNPDHYEGLVLYSVYINKKEIYLSVLKYIISMSPQSISIDCLNRYIYNSDTSEITNLIQLLRDELTPPYQIYWLLHTYSQISTELVSQNMLDDIYDLLSKNSLTNTYLSPLNNIINKYSSTSSREVIWNHILTIINSRIKSGDIIQMESDIISENLEITSNINLLFKIYLHCYTNLKGYVPFDFDCKIITYIIAKYNYLILKYLDVIDANFLGYDKFSKPSKFIWQLPNYDSIMDVILNRIVNRRRYIGQFDFFKDLFGNGDIEIQKEYLRQKINSNVEDTKLICIVFGTIANKFSVDISKYIDELLSLTSDIELFKSIQLLPSGGSCTGSVIPTYQGYLDTLKRIRDIIFNKEPKIDYIEHIDYIDNEIKCQEGCIRQERRREFSQEY